MHYRLESGNSRHIVRVNDDSTEDPFAVVFDPDAGQSVVDALNANSTAKTPQVVTNIANGHLGNGTLVQAGVVHGGVRS